ncbi:aldo/keto reductase [Glutamicibacter arilaitensis]|uniref:aldo/keto reductase n=1 Tax=Glutamicibacter arilaitensis TaxID=256701 RepID=UPI003FCF6C34
MKKRELGSTGRNVTALGLGCMGMSWGYNESGRDDQESEAAIVAAVDAGVDFFDTARIYGDGHNERLVGRALADRPNVVIATKGGIVVDDLEARTMHRDGSPEALRRQIDESLRNLGRDVLDLYYLHRVDPGVPLEESWGAMAEAVEAGKVRWLGLSEVSIDQASRAHEIHPVTAIQSELSLWTRDALGEGFSAKIAGFAGGADQASGDVVAWARDHGASIVPFAPLGRGFLTNTLHPSDFEEGDFRKTNPRFVPEAFERNSAITGTVQEIARAHGATAAQVALAWVLDLGEHVIPIPGTRRSAHLAENLAAMEVNLAVSERKRLDDVPAAVGSRY